MPLLQQMYDSGMSALGYLLPFLAVLTLVIFVHELGHFLIARLCGVRVLVFSIGFGPTLVSRTDRQGTRWRIAAVPLGGYVKFFGDESAASTPDRDKLARMTAEERRISFYGQPVGNRAAIVAAGPIANFLLAIAIFAGSFYFYGRYVSEARVDEVRPGSAAEMAGFRPGDVVLEIEGTQIESFNQLQRIVSSSAGEPLVFRIRRDGRDMELTATPLLQDQMGAFGQSSRIGVLGVSRASGPEHTVHRSYGLAESLSAAVGETWFIVESTLGYLGKVIIGAESVEQLSGPIGIAKISGEAAKLGVQVLLNLAAVLSVSIGLLNLFPVPLLDGGHLLYYAIEALRGRPLSERTQEFGFRIGVAIVLMLMLVATWNDIVQLSTS